MYRPQLLRSVEFSPALLPAPSHWLPASLTLHTSSSISSPFKLSSSLQSCRSQTRNIMSTLNASPPASDPVERTSSPYPDPRQLGPKSKILATRTSNFHSTSLRMVTATNPSVNRTCKLTPFQPAVATISTPTQQPLPFGHNR
jgi:hypothetical protein